MEFFLQNTFVCILLHCCLAKNLCNRYACLFFIDPLGQPKVIVFAHIVRPSVRPHFSNLEKQNNRKQYSLLAWLWVWLSGSLMTPVLFSFVAEQVSSKNVLLFLIMFVLYLKFRNLTFKGEQENTSFKDMRAIILFIVSSLFIIASGVNFLYIKAYCIVQQFKCHGSLRLKFYFFIKDNKNGKHRTLHL